MTEQDITIQAFTELAPTYEETVDQELRQFWGIGYREFIGHFLAKIDISENDIVLDVATGKAIIPSLLAKNGASHRQIIGLDITQAMLVDARETLDNDEATAEVKLVCGSAMEMPFAGSMFDVVICGLGMHHMKATEMLTEYETGLETGGSLLMADVGASYFLAFFHRQNLSQVYSISLWTHTERRKS